MFDNQAKNINFTVGLDEIDPSLKGETTTLAHFFLVVLLILVVMKKYFGIDFRMKIVYLVINNITRVQYVGAHRTSKLLNSYLGSGKKIKEAVNEFGNENFTKKILRFCSTENELRYYEKYYMDFHDTIWPNGYNLIKHSAGSYGVSQSDATIEKYKKSKKKYCKNNKSPILGKKKSKTHILALSQATKIYFQQNESGLKGIPRTDNVKSRISKTKHERKEEYIKICEYCGREFYIGMYIRWHGENCKKKGL